MNHNLLDELKRLAPQDKPEELQRAADELESLANQVAGVVKRLGDDSTRRGLLGCFELRAATLLFEPRKPPAKYPPEFVEWALKQHSDEEVRAGFQEYQETGGKQLHEFIAEIEKEAMPDE
jgi:hypothetical protein